MEELYKAVRDLFEPYQPLAHDIKHALRTASLARQIALAERYDADEAEAAGLLHDVGRTVKDSANFHAHEGAPMARKILDDHTSFSEEAKKRITDAIYVHSDLTTEGKLNNILQDADKLDGLGTLGISRAYMTHYNKQDFDFHNIFPDSAAYGQTKYAHDQIRVQMNWYSMLYTQKAKDIGKARYAFMEKFIEEFKREVAESI